MLSMTQPELFRISKTSIYSVSSKQSWWTALVQSLVLVPVHVQIATDADRTAPSGPGNILVTRPIATSVLARSSLEPSMPEMDDEDLHCSPPYSTGQPFIRAVAPTNAEWSILLATVWQSRIVRNMDFADWMRCSHDLSKWGATAIHQNAIRCLVLIRYVLDRISPIILRSLFLSSFANNSSRGANLKNLTSFQAEITADCFISTVFHFYIVEISFYFPT